MKILSIVDNADSREMLYMLPKLKGHMISPRELGHAKVLLVSKSSQELN
jgi:hypothetical protein